MSSKTGSGANTRQVLSDVKNNKPPARVELAASCSPTLNSERVFTSKAKLNTEIELIEKWLWSLPHNKLKRLSKAISKIKETKYKRAPNKSEGIDRTFTDQELQAFFSTLPNEKYRLMFAVQLSLALRISEVVGINLKHIDPYRQTIAIYEEKTKRVLDKKLPSSIFYRLAAYLDEHKKAIQEHDGYLWYSEGHVNKKRPEPHFSKDYARNAFNRARARAGLTKAYGTSKDGKTLHILATHSFRRTGISKVSDALNGNPFDLKQYSGHKSVRSLEIYVQKKNKERVAEAIEEAFR